jgi:hypothetical protein
MDYKLIGQINVDNIDKEIYLVYGKNCIYVVDGKVQADGAYDKGYGWFLTEQSAIDFCIQNLDGFKLTQKSSQ